jgi:hypothetical protein
VIENCTYLLSRRGQIGTIDFDRGAALQPFDAVMRLTNGSTAVERHRKAADKFAREQHGMQYLDRLLDAIPPGAALAGTVSAVGW